MNGVKLKIIKNIYNFSNIHFPIVSIINQKKYECIFGLNKHCNNLWNFGKKIQTRAKKIKLNKLKKKTIGARILGNFNYN